ncbi:hypothetical protein HYALB_00000852 [Hymenoscyphus albidus]|uniref:Uncharacterized protein n=1 Tax=Hymenoscyphus albidus TaxID=595503 RepID=A0A9N9PQ33_9HELO|nr:hypothetical protein HYALB_00000852 [Hymenoscyphus albidus]
MQSSKSQSKRRDGLVAVFIGATSGIGLGTLKQFAKQSSSPQIYIAGCSESAAASILKELESLNPKGTYVFQETEITLLKNVDKVCEEIKSKEEKVDLLFMSPAYITLGERNDTIEGIDISYALTYYTRLRFTYNLLPLLNASSAPRVISILGGGLESEIDLQDLEIRNNFKAQKAMKYSTTQTTLAFEELANSNPSITFIHKYPGFVNTGAIGRFLGSQKGLFAKPATFFKWFLLPIVNLMAVSVDEAGERGLFLATSARYPPRNPTSGGVEATVLPKGAEVAEDIEGSGVYILGPSDDSKRFTPALAALRLQGASKIVWECTLSVFDRAVGASG